MSKKGKKVAIICCYHIKNYGSVLQAYATQVLINGYGLENECIHYEKKKNVKLLINSFKRCFNSTLLKTKLKVIKKKFYGQIINKDLGNKFNMRNEIFEQFIKRNFKLSKKFVGYDELSKGIKDYDIVVLGSDQVWHPMNLGSNYYTLNFVPKDIPKIAYAPSFGVSKIPNYQKKKTINYLNRIDYLSVREQQGKEIIKELIGKDVPVVLDPTLMLSNEQWDKIAKKDKIVKEKYIFCYFLGNNSDQRDFAKKLSEKTGYKIVTLPHMDEIIKTDFEFGDYKLYNIGPSEFINLIKNAEYVCTDSFHGTAFSIMNHKLFFSFGRYANNSKQSTNSRIQSLLNSLKISNRLCNANDSIEDCIERKIDYSQVDESLEELRKYSRNYLTNAIENSVKK